VFNLRMKADIMKNKHGERITEGCIVRLRRDVAKTVKRDEARVLGWIHGVKGGVEVSRPLDRFQCWNINDLELVPNKNG
jgi:hypothetical protein